MSDLKEIPYFKKVRSAARKAVFFQNGSIGFSWEEAPDNLTVDPVSLCLALALVDSLGGEQSFEENLHRLIIFGESSNSLIPLFFEPLGVDDYPDPLPLTFIFPLFHLMKEGEKTVEEATAIALSAATLINSHPQTLMAVKLLVEFVGYWLESDFPGTALEMIKTNSLTYHYAFFNYLGENAVPWSPILFLHKVLHILQAYKPFTFHNLEFFMNRLIDFDYRSLILFCSLYYLKEV